MRQDSKTSQSAMTLRRSFAASMNRERKSKAFINAYPPIAKVCGIHALRSERLRPSRCDASESGPAFSPSWMVLQSSDRQDPDAPGKNGVRVTFSREKWGQSNFF